MKSMCCNTLCTKSPTATRNQSLHFPGKHWPTKSTTTGWTNRELDWVEDSASAIHFWLCCIATVLNQLRSCSWAIPDCARAALICSSGTLLLSLFYAGTIFPSAFTVAPLLSLEFTRGSRISVGMCVRVRQTCRDIEVCYMMTTSNSKHAR